MRSTLSTFTKHTMGRVRCRTSTDPSYVSEHMLDRVVKEKFHDNAEDAAVRDQAIKFLQMFRASRRPEAADRFISPDRCPLTDQVDYFLFARDPPGIRSARRQLPTSRLERSRYAADAFACC
jgi:hypothetical protein